MFFFFVFLSFIKKLKNDPKGNWHIQRTGALRNTYLSATTVAACYGSSLADPGARARFVLVPAATSTAGFFSR
jgi:hypothetical protein